MDLGLTQSRAARLVGVHHRTFESWELGANLPRCRYRPDLVRFLGCDPGLEETQTGCIRLSQLAAS